MAFGSGTFSAAGSAVSELYAAKGAKYGAEGERLKAQGNRLEGQNYADASRYALQNEKFTETSTAVQLAQAEREQYKMIGGQQTDVASAGFTAGGSALDLLADSTSQASLTNSMLQQQGAITEEGYQVQATAYDRMSQASEIAAQAHEVAAQAYDTSAKGHTIGAVISGVSSVASFFT